MNDIVLAVLNHDYKDEDLNKQVQIYKNTKKERIKNKAFNKLLYAFMNENEMVKIGDIVLMKMDVYKELQDSISDLSETFSKLKDEFTHVDSNFEMISIEKKLVDM